jgi:hypothetical protein
MVADVAGAIFNERFFYKKFRYTPLCNFEAFAIFAGVIFFGEGPVANKNRFRDLKSGRVTVATVQARLDVGKMSNRVRR